MRIKTNIFLGQLPPDYTPANSEVIPDFVTQMPEELRSLRDHLPSATLQNYHFGQNPNVDPRFLLEHYGLKHLDTHGDLINAVNHYRNEFLLWWSTRPDLWKNNR